MGSIKALILNARAPLTVKLAAAVMTGTGLLAIAVILIDGFGPISFRLMLGVAVIPLVLLVGVGLVRLWRWAFVFALLGAVVDLPGRITHFTEPIPGHPLLSVWNHTDLLLVDIAVVVLLLAPSSLRSFWRRTKPHMNTGDETS
jgi:hypothetical protein